jgi:3-hydroxybutyryl-CoA dehydrogenase
MGPFELMDLTGIDVNFPATSFIYQGFQHDPRLKTTTLHELMFNAGRFGRKTRRGYHDYSDAAPLPQEAGPAPAPKTLEARVVEASHPSFDVLRRDHGLEEGGDIALLTLVGEDVATAAHRLGLDPVRTVAIDFTGFERKFLTVMSGLGGSDAAQRVADWAFSRGFRVARIKDSPGFVAPRILAMVANLGCEMAQIGIGSPADIDLAMKLAQNYPKGPLEWADHLGLGVVMLILGRLQSITGSDRYRPSLWLRRRALLGRSIYECD